MAVRESLQNRVVGDEAMKKTLAILALATLVYSAGINAFGQTSQTPSAATGADKSITATGVIGEVTALDPTAKQMTVKTDLGSVVTVALDENTSYMRIPPGEKTLDKATKVTLAEVGAGDRVFARGKVADDQKSVPARMVIVMSKADIAQKQERERAEWQRRGIVGTVTALNPATKEITLTARSREGATPITIVAAGENIRFRRYAPGSVKFSDAKPSSLAELKTGDQLRALGDKSPDGARFTPEEIVSGSFRTVTGTVTAVDPATGEIKINDTQNRQPLTVVVSSDSLLKRFPQQMAAMFAQGGPGGGDSGPPADASGRMQRPQGAPTGGGSQRAPQPPGAEGSRPTGPGGEQMGGRAGMRGMGRGGVDFQEIVERLPPLTVAELKPGDTIIVSSTTGDQPSRVTAIALVAGVDALLNMMQQRMGGANRSGGGPGPSTAIDFGIGLP